MAHNYNGDATGVTPATAIQLTEPDDGDPDNVASVEPTAFHKLANWVKFLFGFVPFLGAAGGGTNWNNTGPDNGIALQLTAGAGGGSATALDATGAHGGAGVNALSADSANGGAAVRANATKAGHLGNAVEILDGLIKWTGGLSPANNVALLNKTTPKLVAKAIALITTDGLGAVALVDGQNIGAVALVALAGAWAGKQGVKITWAQPFLTANYVVHLTYGNGAGPTTYAIAVHYARTAADLTIAFADQLGAGGVLFDAAAAVIEVHVTASGQH